MKSNKFKIVGSILIIALMLTSCTDSPKRDLDGNLIESGLVIKDTAHKESKRTSKKDRETLEGLVAKLRQEEKDGLFSATGNNKRDIPQTIGSFDPPLTEEHMNKLGHMPHKYKGSETDPGIQAPHPDELAKILATLMPLSHEPIDFKQTNNITSDWGTRMHPIHGDIRFHKGIDMGTGGKRPPQFSVWPGTVSYAGRMSGYGNIVKVKHGNDFETSYAHLNEITVKVGDKVGPGDQIGITGTTGGSTGEHLHFEVAFKGQPRDPYYWVKDLPGWESVKRRGNDDRYKNKPGKIDWPSGQEPFTLEDLFEMQRKQAGITGDNKPGAYMAVHEGDIAKYTYMNYNAVTNKKSAQYKLFELPEVAPDDEGFMRYNGQDYLVAMGSYYGGTGDRYEITLQNGTQFTVMLSDMKADGDTDTNNMIHSDDSIIEFVMDKKSNIPRHMHNPSNGLTPPVFSNNLDLKSKIKTIRKLTPGPKLEWGMNNERKIEKA